MGGERRRKFLSVQALTAIRIPLAGLFSTILLLAGPANTLALVLCLFLLILIELTDFLDGTLARHYGLASEWGAMLDPFADSTARLIVYWSFAVAGLLLPLVPLVMALRDITVAYSRIILSRYGRSVKANRSGKIKAVFQCCGAMIAVLGPLYWAYTGTWPRLAISWVVMVVTAASAIQYVMSAVAAANPGRE